MSTLYPVQVQSFALSGAGATAGATSVILKSFQTIDGTNLTMADFGTIGYGTLEPGNGTLEEQISFTGVTQNSNGTATLTGVKTVLDKTPFTETSGLAQTHAGSTTFVISNTAGFYNQFPRRGNDETITGTWTFSVFPITPSNSPASTTVAGVVQEATLAQTRARTQTGSTGAELFMSNANVPNVLIADYVADTGAADAYAIAPTPAITAYTAGQQFSFKALHTNTTASTLNVNSLGVKSITNVDGTALVAGNITVGQIVVVEYDGTAFQLISAKKPVSGTFLNSYVYNSGLSSKNIADASTTQTIAHGLGTTPTRVKMRAAVSNTQQRLVVSDGTWQNSKYTNITYLFIGSAANSTINANTTTILTLYDGSDATASNYQTATIAVDGTNITITWTKTGTPSGTVSFVWEAEGYTTSSITAN